MQNKEKMERLAALSLLVLGIMLVFAVFDANRVNQRLSELQQTVDYGQQLEKLLFPSGGYPATAETAEFAIQKKGVYMTRKKMLLFTLVISMGTVWRLLELLEYGEIEVRQVDTYMYFYMLATCFVAFLVGKESATIKAAKEQKMLQESMPEQQNQTTKKQ